MLASPVATAAADAQELLVERTVAIVGGAAITLSDVRTALALGLVETSGADAEREAIGRLVDRALILQEVSRFAPAEPPSTAVDAQAGGVDRPGGIPAGARRHPCPRRVLRGPARRLGA